MKCVWKVLLILGLIAVSIAAVSCTSKSAAATGLFQGGVTIGPITPVQIQGQTPTVTPSFFTSRKILIYDSTGKNLVTQADIHQIKQTADGYYAVQLEPGTYTVNVSPAGIGGASGLPAIVTISAGQTTILDIDIDTGIR